MLKVNRQHHRQGLTFVELMIGMVVTCLVLSALGVFTFGVGENWQQSDTAQSSFLAASTGVDRLNELVRSAQAIDANPVAGSLTNTGSPAACTIWTDTSGDGKLQYSEMTLLRFDVTNQRLVKYTVMPSTYSSSLMSAASFLSLPNALANPVTVVNNVSACEIVSLSAGSTTYRPSIEFVLQMKTSTGTTATTVYTTVSTRAPANPQ